MDGQTDREGDRQVDGQIKRETDRWTDGQTETDLSDLLGHVELLEDRVHVACGPSILESHKPTGGPAHHWGEELRKR